MPASSIPASAISRPSRPAARAVLEVRSREVPFILEHGQIIGRLVFERLTEVPSEVYGEGLGSSYQRQGLKLSKHFIELTLSNCCLKSTQPQKA